MFDADASRRKALALLLGAAASVCLADSAWARRGEGGGGEGGRGEGGRGQGGRGEGNDGDRNENAGRNNVDDAARAYGVGWRFANADQARDAVLAGQVVPLTDVMPTVRRSVPGSILDVHLAGNGLAWTYGFVVLNSTGRYQEVRVDAVRNRVIQVRQR